MKRVALASLAKSLARSLAILGLWFAASPPAQAQEAKTVYRCPGNPILYTDSISAKEARDKGCRTLEGAPITVIQAQKPTVTKPATTGSGARPADNKVDPNEQKARDSDARRILDAELRKEEEKLAALKKEYNNGEPERLGDERNYQKYLDRTAELKAALARKEADVAAIRRELSKLQ